MILYSYDYNYLKTIRQEEQLNIMDSLSLILLEQQNIQSNSNLSIFSHHLSFFKNRCHSFKNIQHHILNSKQEKSTMPSQIQRLQDKKEQEEQIVEKIQINLNRFTSFENGFMEFHIEILQSTLLNYLKTINLQNNDKTNQKNQKSSLQSQFYFIKKQSNSSFINHNNNSQSQQFTDIKQIIFNQKYYTFSEIKVLKQRFTSNVQQYKILKQIFQSFVQQDNQVIKDAIEIACWIIKNSDTVTKQIKQMNNVNKKQVEKLRYQLEKYMLTNDKITIINRKQNHSQQFQRLVDSWIYTIIIAKLGYFENDCYDSDLGLYQHLQNLLEAQENQYQIVSFYQDEDEEEYGLFDRKLSRKKRKLSDSFFQR